MENKAPFTANEHYLGDYREKFLDSYREAEDEEVMELGDDVAFCMPYSPPPRVAPKPAHIPQVPHKAEVVRAPRDPYEPALHHMASARAYFQGSRCILSQTSNGSIIHHSLVAFKRFTDMVPMTIDQELLRGLDWDRGLYTALTKGLEITGPGSLDKAKEYLQEPPEVVNRRESLLKKRERLQSAKRELQSL